MKLKKYLIPYLFVFLCFLSAVLLSKPSDKNQRVIPLGSELIYHIGNERPVLNGSQGVVIATVTNRREVISIPNKGPQTECKELYATARVVRIEKVLYGNLKADSYVYILQEEHPSVKYSYPTNNGGPYQTNEHLVIFLSTTSYDHKWMERVGSPLKWNYPVFIRANGGHSDRVILDDGQLTHRTGSEYANAAFGQFRTLEEMCTFLSEFDLEKANKDFNVSSALVQRAGRCTCQ